MALIQVPLQRLDTDLCARRFSCPSNRFCRAAGLRRISRCQPLGMGVLQKIKPRSIAGFNKERRLKVYCRYPPVGLPLNLRLHQPESGRSIQFGF